MIKKTFFLLLAISISSGIVFAAPQEKNQEGIVPLQQYFKSIKSLQYDERTKVPSTLIGELQQNLVLSDSQAVRLFFERTSQVFHFTSEQDDFSMIWIKTDELGLTHLRLQQTYKNIPVFGAEMILHADQNNTLQEVSGKFIPGLNINVDPEINGDQAVEIIRRKIGPALFRWENASAEEQLKRVYHDQKKTWVPCPELVISPVHGNYNGGEFRLAWHFMMAIDSPYVANEHYFVDAHTGEVINTYNAIHKADAIGTGQSNYYGTLSFNTNSISSGFQMYDSLRNIKTFDMNHQGPDYVTLPQNPVFNTSNYWVDSSKKVVVDAHWEAEQVYDYYLKIHGRNSFDASGAEIDVGVHLGTNFANAYWDGSEMLFGDGDDSLAGPLTAIDVFGHELTHAVTQTTANLLYQNESGALNEGFSDVFGASIEFYTCANTSIGKTANWWMGEDCWTPKISNDALRYLDNPKKAHQPTTYQGQYWMAKPLIPAYSNDYGGVHQNSSVLGYVYYLMSQGGSGTNDKGYTYSVTGMTIQKAEKIAYDALTKYLISSAEFLDCRQAFLSAATALYGLGSTEYMIIQKAFRAANIGGLKVGLLSPIGNENWYAGDTHAILWTSDEVNAVSIEYTIDSGNTWNIITPSVPALNGTYMWTIPESVTTVTPLKCRIRISAVEDTSVRATSQASFTISPKIPFVAILSPAEGENWKTGSLQIITWVSQFVSNLRVEFFNGILYDTIATNYPASLGSISWVVPAHEYSGCQIRLSDASNPSVVAVSDTFAILRNPIVCDTLFYGYGNSPALYTATSGGYIAGSNSYGDLGKYQKFDIVSPITLHACRLQFGGKTIVGVPDTIWYVVKLANPDGSPGLTLCSHPFLTSIIDTFFQRNAFWFLPIRIYAPFFIGIEWDKSGNDIFGLYSDKVRGGENVHRAWERWSDRTYHQMDGTWNGIDIDLWINALYLKIPVPMLESPLNGEVTQSDTMVFKWNSMSTATAYRLQMSRDSLFTNAKIVYDDSLLTDTTKLFVGLQKGVKYYWRAGIKDTFGSMLWSDIWDFTTSPTVGITATGNLPTKYEVTQNFPNPFNPSTVIQYSLPVESHVRITIYNTLGQIVGDIVNTTQSAGYYSIDWWAEKYASGIYFYQIVGTPIEIGSEFRALRKMLLIK